ncbi:MAG TPA: type 2 lanthipeptide synthetase LanM family protein, partial [Thermoanaerobaculia bacterium]|nr:type 2 lanthipeptide synthetase LanM family protein [Thermoanaerobaculia bacterium]
MPSLPEEADWYRATTLAERAASLPRTGVPAEVNANLAGRRLGRWRSQTPFQDEALLARRLAADGLSLEDFNGLLGEPWQRLRERFPDPPRWLLDLSEAFESGPARLGPEAARKTGVALVAEPVVVRARERLRKVARQIAESRPDAPFAPDSVVELFFDLLLQSLGRAVNRAMILELHIASETGQIQGETPQERFAGFLERVREPEHALGLLRQYPVIARYAVECADRWVFFASEVLEQLVADWDVIRDAFAPAGEAGLLTAVRGGVSDPHRGERTVLLLRFASGFQLVYKPKPLALDAAFQTLLLWLNEQGADPAFRPLRLLDRSGYGWVELITAADCASAEEIRRFYRRQGGYLALFYVLAATDFHYENLLAAGEHPVPIDLETLFHPRAGEVGLAPRERLADDAVWDSVLRPGFLPQRIWSYDNEGVDISGLGAAPGQMTSAPVLQLEKGESGLVRFTRKVTNMEVGSRPLPLLDGRPVEPRAWAGAIAEGFESLYRLLLERREALLAPGGPLEAFEGAPMRVIVRPTHTYLKLLTESFHPFVVQDALDRDRLLDHLWLDIEIRPGLEKIVPHEHLDLERGDVPLFTSFPGSRDVWTSLGERVPDALQDSGLESSRRILLQMGEEDLSRQLRIIRGTLESLDLPAREPLWPSYPFREPADPAPAGRLLAAARAVGDRLEALAFRQERSATWLGFQRMGAADVWSYDPVGYGLYSGVAGISLFLAHLGAVTGEERYTGLAREACRTLAGQIDHSPGAVGEIGACAGWGGSIYALLHFEALWHEPEHLDRAEALVAKLPERIERDEALDVLGGSAGCLLALLRLHARRPSSRTLAAAVLCGERLLATAREMPAGLGWLAPGAGDRPLAGLSHGAAGIAWALAELAAATGEDRYLRACRGALAYERSLFSPAAGNWPDLRVDASQESEGTAGGFMCAWCHG